MQTLPLLSSPLGRSTSETALPRRFPRPFCLACRRKKMVCQAAKELHFNRNMEALKRMQAGVDKLSTVVGVTIGPKVLAA